MLWISRSWTKSFHLPKSALNLSHGLQVICFSYFKRINLTLKILNKFPNVNVQKIVRKKVCRFLFLKYASKKTFSKLKIIQKYRETLKCQEAPSKFNIFSWPLKLETIVFVASNCDDGSPQSWLIDGYRPEKVVERTNNMAGDGRTDGRWATQTPITRNSYIPKAPTNLSRRVRKGSRNEIPFREP